MQWINGWTKKRKKNIFERRTIDREMLNVSACVKEYLNVLATTFWTRRTYEASSAERGPIPSPKSEKSWENGSEQESK